jgi:hypothetical protein
MKSPGRIGTESDQEDGVTDQDLRDLPWLLLSTFGVIVFIVAGIAAIAEYGWAVLLAPVGALLVVALSWHRWTSE